MPAQLAEEKKKQYKPRVFQGTAHVIASRCKGCGWCIEYCPKKILRPSEEFNEKGYHYPIVTDQGQCVNCKVCEDICPDFAIFSLVREETSENGGSP